MPKCSTATFLAACSLQPHSQMANARYFPNRNHKEVGKQTTCHLDSATTLTGKETNTNLAALLLESKIDTAEIQHIIMLGQQI